MEIIVKNCKDCPFKYDSGWGGEEYSCLIDSQNRNVFKIDLERHKNIIKFEDEKDWCPLKTDIVTIKKQ
jgi:hypothetical protein